jgi:hypothetical protein
VLTAVLQYDNRHRRGRRQQRDWGSQARLPLRPPGDRRPQRPPDLRYGLLIGCCLRFGLLVPRRHGLRHDCPGSDRHCHQHCRLLRRPLSQDVTDEMAFLVSSGLRW